jgi:cellulose synthase/poly-beta-1,6-N-acetylglucosamine synthase-like glycosyltransferase
LLTVLSRRGPPREPRSQELRFDVVVPAHDEEAGIERTVRSLLALDWPVDRFRVLVVADNCADRTAERAEAAGALVLVRTEPGRRGKGYALRAAFDRVLGDEVADAVVVVDADTVASRNLLSAFAARLEAGELAVQSRNAVLNHDASWRTRLMTLAFALFNEVRSLGRERLRLSCGLRGNGMCIARAALLRAPYGAFSIVEDLEYGIVLGERGIRVAYAEDACVSSEMVTSERASRSQRRRWEGGRVALRKKHGLALLRAAFRDRSRLVLDLALDVLLPPLSWIAAYAATGTVAAGLLSLVHGAPAVALLCWGASLLLLGAHVVRGWQVSSLGVRGLAALAWVPFYFVWKVWVGATRPAAESDEFIRTTRERPP